MFPYGCAFASQSNLEVVEWEKGQRLHGHGEIAKIAERVDVVNAEGMGTIAF